MSALPWRPRYRALLLSPAERACCAPKSSPDDVHLLDPSQVDSAIGAYAAQRIQPQNAASATRSAARPLRAATAARIGRTQARPLARSCPQGGRTRAHRVRTHRRDPWGQPTVTRPERRPLALAPISMNTSPARRKERRRHNVFGLVRPRHIDGARQLIARKNLQGEAVTPRESHRVRERFEGASPAAAPAGLLHRFRRTGSIGAS